MQDFDRLSQHKAGDARRSCFPAYHMWLSTRDMARVGYLMLREGNWSGRQIVPGRWIRKITSLRTPLEEMNPPFYREGHYGYGYMWWILEGSLASGPYRGAYLASGAHGQFIAVLPELDMVIAHKTAVPPNERQVSRSQFEGIIERLKAARTAGGDG
jgi:CubicO group peptidase (beta-lactamase class C family)